jgi:dihydrofolate reductase/thymidylate synthase
MSHSEQPYLDLLQRILDKGVYHPDRTGTGVYSYFGDQLRLNIKNQFPLLTTKKMFWKGIVEELLWFLRGQTDNKILTEKGVHIWDGNSSREFLDKSGLTEYEEGDCGPIYSFQWKHFGAEYKDCHTDYTGQGVDQVAYLLKELKENPNSRRIFMSAWNPSDLEKMCLPPCHVSTQFYVKEGKYLSCHMYMRSCDAFLGLPFNIASYALLTYLLAAQCGYTPDELIISFGNLHLYANHLEQVKEQLSREPMSWCTLELDEPSTWTMDTVTSSQIHVKNYQSHSMIKAPMAV